MPVRVLSRAYSCYAVSFMRLLMCRLFFVRSVYVLSFVWSPCLSEGSVPEATISCTYNISIIIIVIIIIIANIINRTTIIISNITVIIISIVAVADVRDGHRACPSFVVCL